jgi:hypothetical protein
VFLQAVIAEIERRIGIVDARELTEARRELDERMQDWEIRGPKYYINGFRPNQSLLQPADRYARRRAAGRSTGAASAPRSCIRWRVDCARHERWWAERCRCHDTTMEAQWLTTWSASCDEAPSS